MKKNVIISAILVVYMFIGALAFVSCGGSQSVEGFSKAISATKPATVEGGVTMYTEFGPLNSTYTANIAEDGSFVLDYTYEKFDSIGSGTSSDPVSKNTGSITYKDGVYSDSSINAKIPADMAATKLKLDAGKMTYKVSNDGNVLAGKVKASDTKAIFGVKYGADVNFVLTKANDKIVSLSLTYTLTEGKVEVYANYK